MVAIPAVGLFNALSQRVGRLLVAVEAAGEELAVTRLRGSAVGEESR
jgi:biopolymer transport protein ExbB/TolQ